MKNLVRIVLGGMEKITGNRWIGLAVSGILIATALVEVVESVSEVRAHHGLLIYGIFHLFRTMPEFFHGAIVFEEAEGVKAQLDN